MKYQSAAAPLALLILLANLPSAAAAELTSQTSMAFDDYLRQAREAFLARVRTDVSPTTKTEGVPARPGHEDGIVSVPGGLIHHWVGGAFIPRATLQRALAVSNAYDAYSSIYKEVIASKLVGREGDTYQVLIRIKDSEAGVGAVLDILSTVRYFRPTPRLCTRSRLRIKSARSRTRARPTSAFFRPDATADICGVPAASRHSPNRMPASTLGWKHSG